MKKLLFLVIFAFAYADISNILIKIKTLEECRADKPYVRNIFLFKPQKPFNDILCEEEKKEIKIKAVLNDRVLIGDKWYKVGDEVNGYKIVQITDKFVKFKTDNGYLKIPLFIQKVLR